MLAVSEVARLKRDVEQLTTALKADKPGSKTALTLKDRRALKSEIDWCIQELDELRGRLTG